MSVYLAKMSVHHEHLSTKKTHLIGASAIYVALKICEQMRQQVILTKEIMEGLIQATGNVQEIELIETSKKLLYLA